MGENNYIYYARFEEFHSIYGRFLLDVEAAYSADNPRAISNIKSRMMRKKKKLEELKGVKLYLIVSKDLMVLSTEDFRYPRIAYHNHTAVYQCRISKLKVK
jgi:hypothetical protein